MTGKNLDCFSRLQGWVFQEVRLAVCIFLLDLAEVLQQQESITKITARESQSRFSATHAKSFGLKPVSAAARHR